MEKKEQVKEVLRETEMYEDNQERGMSWKTEQDKEEEVRKALIGFANSKTINNITNSNCSQAVREEARSKFVE